MTMWIQEEEPEYIEQVNSPEQQSIEKKKFTLVNAVHNDKEKIKQDCTYCISLIVSGQKVEFYVPDDDTVLDLEYLKYYLKEFSSDIDNEKVYTRIYYSPYVNKYSHPDDLMWGEKNYYTRTESTSTSNANSFNAVHRCFVGHINITNGECFIRGPHIVKGYSDLIDNIFLTCVAPKLIASNSLALHAATVVYNNEAYVFYGPSGVGKSTIAEFCHETYGLKVMSGDQIYLRLEDGHLWAHPCISTIHNFHREHPAWESKSKRVKLLAALTRGSDNFSFINETPVNLIGRFLREIVYLPNYKEEGRLLDLALNFLENNSKSQGIMSYRKDYKFWDELLKQIDN